MIPVVTDDGLAWIRTIVVVSSSSSATPRLYSVLAVSNGVVGIGSTVNEAIAATAGAD